MILTSSKGNVYLSESKKDFQVPTNEQIKKRIELTDYLTCFSTFQLFLREQQEKHHLPKDNNIFCKPCSNYTVWNFLLGRFYWLRKTFGLDQATPTCLNANNKRKSICVDFSPFISQITFSVINV